jgi:hypothetical protein
MRLLEALANIFINTFGITQPSDKTRRQAAWFILGLLVAALAVVSLIGFTLYQLLHRQA